VISSFGTGFANVVKLHLAFIQKRFLGANFFMFIGQIRLISYKINHYVWTALGADLVHPLYKIFKRLKIANRITKQHCMRAAVEYFSN